jgi:hypothetical protein
MRKILFLLAAFTAFFLPAAAHAYCYGVPDPIAPPSPLGHVCGYIYRFGYNGSYNYWKAAGASYVKLCPKGSTSGCTTVTTTTQTNGGNSTFQAFTFPYFRLGSTGYEDFDIYIWSVSSTDYWGSSSKPQGWTTIGPYGVQGYTWAMPPRPLEPIPVYPTGTTVPNAYLVRWKSGVDIDRQPYPRLYEVWFKYWPFGGTEPASWSLSTDTLPCHADGSGPDANNECSTYVSGPQLAGNWKWYMVAKFDMSSVISYPNTIYSTQSRSVSFIQPN